MTRWWIVLLMLTPLWSQPPLPPWFVMLAISLSIFAVLKTTVFLDYIRPSATRVNSCDAACWFFAWPGLNAHEFFARRANSTESGPLAEWMAAAAGGLLGWGCLLELAPRVTAWNRLAAGWLAMLGLLLIFHFGGFHLLALCWRRCGRSVQPIMRSPLLAESLSDFWSHRWNLAFRDFAARFVLRPLARRSSSLVGLWGCFVFSGLVHELAISVPARSGYGLPLAYFLLQALGVSIERSTAGSRLRLNHGTSGRLFAFLVIGPPAFFLFHPPFITKVILPLAGISEATP